ncbi:MAG: spore germination protein GerW family protein [Bacteroidia bacterium]
MSMNFDEMLQKVTDFIRTEAKTESVIGTPFTLGEFTCVPVIRVGFGFGAGGGDGEQPGKGHGVGGGAGAGMGIEPVGFLVSKGSEIQFVSTQHSKGLAAALEKAPDVLMKYFETHPSAEKKAEPEPVVTK